MTTVVVFNPHSKLMIGNCFRQWRNCTGSNYSNKRRQKVLQTPGGQPPGLDF